MMGRQPVVTANRKIAQSRIFHIVHIEELEITFPNGARRTCERLPGATRDCVIILPYLDDGTILPVREYASANECYELSLPKGMVIPAKSRSLPPTASCRETNPRNSK